MKTSRAILSVVSLLSLGFGMSGCMLTESKNDIGGHLYVRKAFAMLDKDGSATQLEAGKDYDTVLHMAEQGSDLAVHPTPISSIDALFSEPAADRLGKFAVAASASKQAFDLSGDIDQTSSSTPETGSDACILGYREEVICREVVEPSPAPAPGQKPLPPKTHRECRTETITVYGRQYYRAIRNTTDRLASLTLTDPSTKDVLATFSGSYRISDYLSDKVMTSPCLQ